MKLKKLLINIFIAVLSSAVALLLGEIGARLFLDPVDFLSPTLVRNAVLGISLPPKTSGHDEWGFRNRKVLPSAQIVALGDSHTYGNCAKMTESWPYVLESLTGKSVYNLGMGGYGPIQYFHLFKTKALGLKPRVIIFGLYMGDDFDNAFRIAYGLDYWSFLRQAEFGKVDADIWEKETSDHISWHKKIRNWLSSHSIIYQHIVHGALTQIKGRFQVENAARLYDSTASLIMSEQNLREAFRPQGVLRGLDQQEPSVREGMRITFELLQEMNAICASNHIQFVVAVIPTKETVFSRYLEHNIKLSISETIDIVILNERLARQKLFAMFKEQNIHYVDLLLSMESHVQRVKLYTYSGLDMHPNKNGYRIMAETIAQYLDTLDQKQ